MTAKPSVDAKLFDLRGHDCPLGLYPSVVTPVGVLDGTLVATYFGQEGPEFYSVDTNSKYKEHSESTNRTINGFDPLKHGLFAFSEDELVMYDLGNEGLFYSRLLRYSPAFFIEPFYRLSLAIEANEIGLIRPVYFSCARHLKRDAPEYLSEWMKVMEGIQPDTRTSSSLLASAA